MLSIGSSLYHEGSNHESGCSVIRRDDANRELETQENILRLSSNDYVEHHVDLLWLSGTRILAKRVTKIVGDCHGHPFILT